MTGMRIRRCTIVVMLAAKLSRLSSRAAWLLVIGLIIIAVMHVVTAYASLYHPGSYLSGIAGTWDLDMEYNVPTYYSGAILLGVAVAALAMLKKAKARVHKLVWLMVSLMFAYWALDETLVIHEQFSEPIRDLLSITSGVYYHAWVVLAIPLAVVLGLGLLFIYHLRKRPFSAEQIRLFSLVFFTAVGIIVLEAGGTLVFENPPWYRLVAIPAEELFEISMASYILVSLIRQTENKPKKSTRQKLSPKTRTRLSRRRVKPA